MPLPDPASPQPGFDFELDAWHLGRGLLASLRQNPQRLLRHRPLIQEDGRDQYVLMLGEDSPRISDVEGNMLEIAPGRICLFDLSRPFEFIRNSTVSTCYVIPRGLLDEALPPGDRHGVVLEGGIASLLAEYLLSLRRNIEHLDEKDFSSVNRAARNLLAAAIDHSEETVARAKPAANAALRMRAERLIERRLGRSSVSIEGLCRELSVSRSHLYRIFAECGGVAAYITKRRLAKAKASLESGDKGTICDLAHRHGFADEAYFSRAFRRTYGFSPRDCRRAGGQVPDVPRVQARSGRHPWADWVESLEP